MKIISFLLILFLCSYVENKDEKEIEIKLAKPKGGKFICISIKNNTNKKLYIPKCRGLGVGLNVYKKERLNKLIDLNDDFYSSYFSFTTRYNYDSIVKCCNLNNYKLLSEEEKDSIAKGIVKESENKHHYLKNKIVDELSDLLMLEPYKQFNAYFEIPDSSIYSDSVLIVYKYPYPYPLIKTGPYSLTEEQLSYNLKVLDSLKFSYPKNIVGYELYNKPIISDTLYINACD